jgi:hypothetical protein
MRVSASRPGPARTELDDTHRTVTELRRELRALKRQSTG